MYDKRPFLDFICTVKINSLTKTVKVNYYYESVFIKDLFTFIFLSDEPLQ